MESFSKTVTMCHLHPALVRVDFTMKPRFLKTLYSLLAVVTLLLAGCAHRVDWNTRIGTYTLDQAIIELGPPDKQAKTSDGTTVAEWVTRSGYTQTYGGGWYGPAWGGYYGSGGYYGGPVYTSSYPDYYLRLVFSPDGKLHTWKKFYR